jgi:Response receiver domain
MSLDFSNFDGISKQIAKDFLRSVVVVDDHPVFEDEEVVGELEAPDLVVEASPSETPAAEQPATAPDPHTLPFNRFSESFATVGIFCTVLSPEKEHLDDFVTQSAGESGLANRADVVILDWVLHGFKEGEKALDIIAKLTQGEGGVKPRKRLILVYTGESDLLGIAKKIRDKLNVAAVEGGTAQERTHITLGATTIAIYAKPHVKVAENLQSLVASAEAIPEIVISEFARTSPGLLSNLILRSMGVLRSETYQILKKFPTKLDCGFVTHKVLQNPEEASTHLLPLVVSEIQTALEDNIVIEVLSEPALAAWLNSKIADGFVFGLEGVTEDETRNGVQELLKRPVLDVVGDGAHGNFVRGFLKSKNKARGEVADRLTQLLSGETSHRANQEFAILMSIRSRYGTPPPRLTLGTIVHDASRGIYLLCAQPRCDSVRLTGERQFPFLPLKVADDGYDHVVMHGADIITLRLIDEPYRMEMIGFQPWTEEEREVLARPNGDRLFFKSGTREDNFQWIAELRSEHAQRIANALAGKISRVGLNESEWLRLNAKREND